MTQKRLSSGAISWSLFDWANSAFATSVIAGFFPIFFKDYWSKGLDSTQSTFLLGVTISAASLVSSLLSPVLGTIADQAHSQKKLLFCFTLLGILSTAALYCVTQGQWPIAMLLYGLAMVGFLVGNVFYNAMLVNVSQENNVDFISSFGYALGYLGGGILFFINVLMIQFPHSFGLNSPTDAVRVAFLTVALWWALFSVPLFKNVKENKSDQSPVSWTIAAGNTFSQLFQTIKHISQYQNILIFLIAYWLYIDGVDTIIVMAVDYGKNLGFAVGDLLKALLMVQLVGFPFSILSGWLGQRCGAKPLILASVAVYFGLCIFGGFIDLEPYMVFGFSINKFYLLAFLLATVQGGIQSLSRSFYSRLIPVEHVAEFFGFYNMVGKFAAIVGPVLTGTVTKLSGSPRLGIISIASLFLLGGLFLFLVKNPEKKAS